ncbi:MAG: hypothetical protein JWL95_3255 [Gemmatimonadetes bacterium]|nr:hypothetical protein [Gemmatimonadota bacterium]
MNIIKCLHSSARSWPVGPPAGTIKWCINCGALDSGGGWQLPERPVVAAPPPATVDVILSELAMVTARMTEFLHMNRSANVAAGLPKYATAARDVGAAVARLCKAFDFEAPAACRWLPVERPPAGQRAQADQGDFDQARAFFMAWELHTRRPGVQDDAVQALAQAIADARDDVNREAAMILLRRAVGFVQDVARLEREGAAVLDAYAKI